MVTSTILAYITAYSIATSCHNKNVQGECLMANGRVVSVGSVACPRSIKLGVKVEIDGKTYTCSDRYSKSLDQKRRLPTFDIYSTSSIQVLKQFGIKKKYVKIYDRS